MTEDELTPSKRVLDPLERSSEVLFGLIMVLTFTSSISVADYGRTEIRTMVIGALGCNLAWGMIDAIMYLMASLSERGHGLAALNAVHSAATPEAAHKVIRDELPPLVASTMAPSQFEQIRQSLLRLPAMPRAPRLTRNDWWGALGVFLLVFLSTFPVVAPFLVIGDVQRALRVSNGVAIVMLATTGYSYGHYSGGKKWLWALTMVLLSGGMVALTIRFGG